jgi:group II intron reverse transcriptase/maturase
MEDILEPGNWESAWRAVVANHGAPGIDGMKCEQLVEHLRAHGESLRTKLLAGTYVPSAVRRKSLPKPGGGERHLGIGTVQDRFIQQMIQQVLGRIWEPRFSAHSYGFRPKRSAQQAVRQAQAYYQAGKDHVVDLDIEKFFDRVNHDILMSKVGAVIRDKRVLRLIGRYLRAGIMVEGVVIESTEGTPQGGPLSPLLANIYLDELDKELEARGLSFVRYADDCNIYVGSQAAAERVSESIVSWIEKHLRLKVNQAKSGAGPAAGRKILGFALRADGQIEVSAKSLQRFKDRVREIWRSCQSVTNKEQRDTWNSYAQHWWNYYQLAQWRRPVSDLVPWIRRHIRKFYWLRWHKPKGRYNALKRLGVKPAQIQAAYSSKGAWSMSRHPVMNTAISNAKLKRFKYYFLGF